MASSSSSSTSSSSIKKTRGPEVVELDDEHDTAKLKKRPKILDELRSKKTISTKQPQPQESQGINNAVSNVLNSRNEQGDLITYAPKQVPGVGAPATNQQRMRNIAVLIQAFTSNGEQTPVQRSVEEEFKVAKISTKITYNSNLRSLLKKVRNNELLGVKKTEKLKKLTDSQMYDEVCKLVPDVVKLEKEGYITMIPELKKKEKEGEGDEDEEDLSKKNCDRCGTQFDLNNILTPTNPCQFHERKKRSENNDKYWECCSQVVGESQGCKTNKYHVFKAKTGWELHTLIPFIQTPNRTSPNSRRIVGLDCEMGYTTKGLELIRLTIMDFYTGKLLYDEVVKPFGQVLDLNTTWSGVSEIPENALNLTNTLRVILGNVIDRDTIIIGHGLENDLNTLRLIHHKVVDTAIIFPKSLTRKFALKDLSFMFLDRVIQSGQHSSEEDSLAAIDIVKKHVLTMD